MNCLGTHGNRSVKKTFLDREREQERGLAPRCLSASKLNTVIVLLTLL